MQSEVAVEPRIGSIAVVDGKIEAIYYAAETAETTETAAEITAEAEEETFLRQNPSCEIIECEGKAVMPGLINTHTHVSMTLMRNYADDMELMEWLTQHIWKFEAELSVEDIAAGARLGIAEMLLGGTTTFVDMYWSDFEIAKVVDQMGIRALLAESVLDGREGFFVRDMDRLREVSKDMSRVECAVGPHAPYTCSAATLALARDYAAQHNLPITIHLSETLSEQETIKERYGCTPAEYLDREGMLSERTILAHAIYLSDSDIELIASRGCSIAHNAQSNLKLASGIAPVVKYMRGGINCTIATDGASSNNDLDMWEELRTASLLQRVVEMDPAALDAYKTLLMATRYGARAIGRSDLGVLREGATADIIVVDLSAVHLRPRHNVVSSLVYCAKSSDVSDVLVDGVVRVRGGVLMGVDLESEIRDVEARCRRIVEKLRV